VIQALHSNGIEATACTATCWTSNRALLHAFLANDDAVKLAKACVQLSTRQFTKEQIADSGGARFRSAHPVL